MAKQSRLLILIPSLAVIVGIAFFMMLPSEVEHEVVEFSRDTIMIDDIELIVQLADTDHRRADGLMFQRGRADARGAPSWTPTSRHRTLHKHDSLVKTRFPNILGTASVHAEHMVIAGDFWHG